MPATEQHVSIRRATPGDAEACGKICFEAFAGIARQHNFPPDLPSADSASSVMGRIFANPGFFCVVAEQDGKIVGSNCMDERTPIAGVGPITVDPGSQNKAAGRQLMQAVMDRAAGRNFAGVRLVQAAYHGRSLSLYAKLGFVVREPLACMNGPAIQKTPSRYQVRPARHDDLAACNELCRRVHGHDRGGEVRDAIERGGALVAESDGIRAYASAVGFFGHAVGETTEDLQALLAAATEFQGPGILVPTRNAKLFRWCLENGLRVIQPMTLTTMGLYNEPAGAYLSSILY